MGIITKGKNGWCTTQLLGAMKKQNITPMCLSFSQLVARVEYKPVASVGETKILKDLDALITRPIGRGSLEEIIFRMNLLYRLERLGMLI